jgi:hypothetical protein
VIVVIQCAATKRPDAGFLKLRGGKKVMFVAQPAYTPLNNGYHFARPDDLSDEGTSWRDVLVRYNDTPSANVLELWPAYKLYANPVYGQLVDHFGLDDIYILSAGWGLIQASFLTPNYDITFTAAAENYKRRKKSDNYLDACMLENDSSDPIVFLGGNAYLPLFCNLTRSSMAPRTVFYNSVRAPEAPGCEVKRFATTTRTNWHYECAKALIEGKLRTDV